MIILGKLSELPHSAGVALYGTGEAGFNFLNLLKKYRPDVNVTGMIDSFKGGEKNGLPVYRLDQFVEQFDDNIWILITTRFWKEILQELQHFRRRSVIVVPIRFLWAESAGTLEMDKSIEPVENPLDNEWYKAEHRQRWQTDLAKTQALLKEPEDLQLFRLLTGESRGHFSYSQALCHYFFHSTSKGQYRDYIRYKHVTSIIEGGVFDGGSMLHFLEDAGESTTIFGFEPNYENFKKGPHYRYLNALNNIEVLPYGLWSSDGQLHFLDSGSGTRIIPENALHKTPGNIISVDVMSIDAFVKQRLIEKVDMIKMDIEGAEPEALLGAENTLKEHRPQLAICIYHRREHLFQIPLLLDSMLNDYIYRIGHYAQDFKETVWYAVPREMME